MSYLLLSVRFLSITLRRKIRAGRFGPLPSINSLTTHYTYILFLHSLRAFFDLK
uniref:Uncharacterized protein n=1 Tax=Lepeophtheirus salmonis TaxID=72036 RepID=A0A0K2U661_LEPSM